MVVNAQTVKHLRWFEVVESRGSIDGDKVRQWQVTIKAGYTLEGDVVRV